MKVSDCMTSPARVCGIDETCSDAARKMWDGDCGFVVVTDRAGRVAGVVTDRDLCMGAWTTGKSLGELPVARVMATEVRTIQATEDAATALAAMANQQVHRLPVVQSNGAICGVVSLTDLARSSAIPGDMLARSMAAIASPRNPHSPRIATAPPAAVKPSAAPASSDPVIPPPTPAAKQPSSAPAQKPAAKRKSR